MALLIKKRKLETMLEELDNEQLIPMLEASGIVKELKIAKKTRAEIIKEIERLDKKNRQPKGWNP